MHILLCLLTSNCREFDSIRISSKLPIGFFHVKLISKDFAVNSTSRGADGSETKIGNDLDNFGNLSDLYFFG